MTILVTGGAGFIGSHTVVSLLENDFNVLVVDNFSNSSPDAIKSIENIVNKKVDFIEGDVRDEHFINKIFKDYNISDVIHFAGLKSVNESIDNPISYYDNNVNGTLVIINALLNNGGGHIIFSSSATVYGEPEKIPLVETCRIGGTTNPYGTSKLFSEHILKDAAKVYSNLKVTVLRYFNPVGAHPSGIIGEKPLGTPNNLVPFLTQVAMGKQQTLSVYGSNYPTPDGTGVRDFIHVMDLAEGHLAALKKSHCGGNWRVYNLGTGKGYSVIELIKTFERVNNIKINYKFCANRSGDIAECWSDPSLAARELNWKASRTLEDMMRDSWRWEQYCS